MEALADGQAVAGHEEVPAASSAQPSRISRGTRGDFQAPFSTLRAAIVSASRHDYFVELARDADALESAPCHW